MVKLNQCTSTESILVKYQSRNYLSTTMKYYYIKNFLGVDLWPQNKSSSTGLKVNNCGIAFQLRETLLHYLQKQGHY